ncbi:4-(cytidine 5'-diphospho)-2-C-methyl-D-erythritol kinase [Megasphaera vaginalis (ex Bordigoni et al. 2020)]|uniref:4-(cytidine 5'-diphospho)-2-C-methyl-D-erythritol kinase n=1 Tax=Megasphaera vaginalis (ex Bordigoni et al. 2020) TaxID=2045301 RepID=UPI000C7CAA03|nr:4-(cytidine 5'-diphospho)-2-C-methyl-D-erythritol kinase [Megasphaera vaginalis (ex Bordigoni et al. 2020)]
MIEETGCGKINLALAITGRRPDGYHEIDTVFQSIALHDTIRLTEAERFTLTCSDKMLPCNEENLAYRAYQALLPYRSGDRGVHIHIEKRLPVAAGLAGGSADCAAVLRGLNRLWELGLSSDALARIGAGLGADVPFCVYGGTMHGRGIGERLEALPPLPPWQVLLVHPRLEVHTNQAYALYDKRDDIREISVEAVVAAVRQRNFRNLLAAINNTFEDLVVPQHAVLIELKRILKAAGFAALLSGSGPTFFALLSPEHQHENMQERFGTLCGDADIFLTTLAKGDGTSYEE